MEHAEIQKLVKQMTLTEKAGMLSGADFWHLKGVERLHIPQIMVTDGPHGLRKQEGESDHLGLNASVKATCFPAGCAAAAGFDPELTKKIGEKLGDICQAEEVAVILGPAMNIKRSPLCGRNFEYYSEDPLLSAKMAGGLIEGVQSRNVGTSVKHFLANNQEHRRMTSSSEVDERTLREIYLAAFEGAIKEQQPWTVMCSYNKINGVHASDSKLYLNDILREEWGFEGFVMTDWGAVSDRVLGVASGLDLEMPGSGGKNDAKIVKAVQEGRLDEAVVDRACERILNIIFRYAENKKPDAGYDYEEAHQAARLAENECAVLLKNEDGLLPFKEGRKLAVIGTYAERPRFQGGGSSHINAYRVSSFLDAVKDRKIENLIYAKGFRDERDESDEALIDEAVRAAKEAGAAVIFAGLPDAFESEGYDRKHLRLPDCQNRLIGAVCAVQPNTAVVLHNGSPVEMPWISRVKAVLELYLGGEAVGLAAADLLFGRANPCGRLPETFPLKLSDTPTYPYYGREDEKVIYREGVFVGYRYYETKEIPVLFPFGHGLSYTTFEYSDLMFGQKHIKDTDRLSVSVSVTNTGDVYGKEVVQLYVAPPCQKAIRPVKELRAFRKIGLEPGETKQVTFELDKRAFAYWNTQLHDWHVESGEYEIQIGKSAHETVLRGSVTVESTVRLPKVFTAESTIGDIMADPKGAAVFSGIMEKMRGRTANDAETMNAADTANDAADESGDGVTNRNMMAEMLGGLPLRALVSLAPDVTEEQVAQIVERLNR